MIVKADDELRAIVGGMPLYECTRCLSWYPETAKARHERSCHKVQQ